MKVLDVSANHVCCETFRLGLDISSTVCDGCHSIEVDEATLHKDSTASLVSSMTPTFTRSDVVPSFFVTGICQLRTVSTRNNLLPFLRVLMLFTMTRILASVTSKPPWVKSFKDMRVES